MKYQIISQSVPEIPVEIACQALGVSRSGYYKSRKRRSTKRERDNKRMLEEIRTEFKDTKGRAGSPTITIRLRRRGIVVNKKRVARLMKINGLVARAARKFKRTTDSNHPYPPAPNLLAGMPVPGEKNKVWVTDITYLWTPEGWLYLCVFIDLCTRKVVGWSVSERMKASLVCQAFMMALLRENPGSGLIVHSDRGSQYASREFRSILGAGVCQSMSGAGRCYDNAYAESFFHTLKVEWLYGTYIEGRAHARRSLFEYLEVYYNRNRIHSSIGYLTPVEMDEKISRAA
jgi:transposase InsO family protein